ncbi:hypothetical protein [Pelosinus sp. IPA-1]|nr:hypothetical protein [Pelosinus sp. IPA-1]GMA98530.1 hypothetical protein PIPA1_13300 [Pelosinus sp. IPA-1]
MSGKKIKEEAVRMRLEEGLTVKEVVGLSFFFFALFTHIVLVVFSYGCPI